MPRPVIATVLLVAACGAKDDSGTTHHDTDVATATGTGTGATPAPHWALAGDFLAVAHRGGATHAPENTIEAIELARANGARIVEVDVQKTVDDHLVLLHDVGVDRTTDGLGRIAELTLAEAQALDAGYSFTPDGGATYPYRGQGVVIPTFPDALAAGSDLFWLVEIKQDDPPITDAVIAAVEDAGMADRVFYFAFETPTIRAVRNAQPDAVTAQSESEYLAFIGLTDQTEASYTPPAPIVMSNQIFLTDDHPARAERLGITLLGWTINDGPVMERWLDAGIDGIISDDVPLLQGLVADRGLPQP